MILPSPALIQAAWITAAIAAVCLALCTIHSRKSSSSSSSVRRRASSRSGLAPHGSTRPPCRDQINGVTATTPGATPAAKVSPTPSDTAAKGCCVVRVGDDDDDVTLEDVGGPVTVIDVGTHGPIAPVFPPVPDPMPPRRSLSAKHVRFAERLGGIRSRRWGLGDDAADDEEAGHSNNGQLPDRDATLWTKTILLGERCRVPSAGAGDCCENDGDGDGMVRWKSYRPRQPRSVPLTRSNSFAGVVGGSCRPAARGARF